MDGMLILNPSQNYSSSRQSNNNGGSNNTMRKFKSCVVGAGPAGVCAVGNLLEVQPPTRTKIAWIDPLFQAGRVNSKYRQVPR